MDRTFFGMGAALAALAVGAGAFGAHGLRAYFEEHPKLGEYFQTAAHYHLVHAVALLGIGWACYRWPGSLTTWSGILIVVGIVVFSGSLYTMALSGARWLGAITPIGGVALIAGWVLAAVAVLRPVAKG